MLRTPVSDEMVERAWRAFQIGPPGVLRRVQHIDSYPGEYPGDPEAYTTIATSTKDQLQALREAIEAALS